MAINWEVPAAASGGSPDIAPQSTTSKAEQVLSFYFYKSLLYHHPKL